MPMPDQARPFKSNARACPCTTTRLSRPLGEDPSVDPPLPVGNPRRVHPHRLFSISLALTA